MSKSKYLVLILGWIVSFNVSASTFPSAEEYAKLPAISELAISPSAKRYAFRQTDGKQDFITVFDRNQKKNVAAVNVTEVKPDNVYFINDSKIVLVTETNTRPHGYRGRHDISTAAVYDITANKVHRLLAPGYGIHLGQTRVGKIVGISGDHKYAYMPAYKEKDRYSLLKSSLEKRRQPRIHKKGTQDTIDFFVDNQGELFARERYSNAANLHRVQAYFEGSWKTIFEQKVAVPEVGFSGLTPDYQALVMAKINPETGRWAYYRIELATGEVSGPIFNKQDRDVEGLITDINRVVYGVRYSGFEPSYEFFEPKLNARMRGIAKAVPNNSFKIVDFTPDWSKIVFFMEG
jgi:hypothetical protein